MSNKQELCNSCGRMDDDVRYCTHCGDEVCTKCGADYELCKHCASEGYSI